ncbi:hypothetical protein MHYMCMPSP_00905 [Hyalomma marginatum]|uniref:Uncharacterized protein n=1 Tax=Hyalomma marginatum TaxID=34627 RepID=A0A8S4C2M6_9ACAR|nr:hypothetical protein MHYMCMPASI_00780 [Hyalomma marginatum]CAG7594612.1 hypothetical protein MHYMCMPSP_00905 [Hyalomma marginatum]
MKSSSLKHITYDEFPLYSIIVPYYKESEVLPSLLYNLFKLNYPKATDLNSFGS